MKIGFFEEAPGVKSSTRLNIFMILVIGLLQVSAIIASGIWLFVVSHGDKVGLAGIVGPAASLFGAVVLPCVLWKSISKPQEGPATADPGNQVQPIGPGPGPVKTGEPPAG